MNDNKNDVYAELHSITETEAKKIVEEIPDGSSLESLSELFRALGDLTKVKIIYLLSRKEMCVHDLATLLEASQSSVSHHLKTLKLNDLVKARREGKAVYYSLDDPHVEGLFTQCIDHVDHKVSG